MAGLETNDTNSLGLEQLTNITGTGNSIATDQVYSGARSLRMQTVNGTVPSGVQYSGPGLSLGTGYYLRARFRRNRAGSTVTGLSGNYLCFGSPTSIVPGITSGQIDTTALTLRYSVRGFCSIEYAINDNQWYLLELYLKLVTGSSDELAWRVDGVLQETLT